MFFASQKIPNYMQIETGALFIPLHWNVTWDNKCSITVPGERAEKEFYCGHIWKVTQRKGK